MSLLRNAMIYLGFAEDDLAGEIGAYQEPFRDGHANIRQIPAEPSTTVRTVRRVRPIDQVHVVEPESYQDSVEIGDKLRDSVPVIVNLKGAEADLAKRVMAFACGLIYALDGSMQKLLPRVYLITPPHIEVSTEDRQRLASLDLAPRGAFAGLD